MDSVLGLVRVPAQEQAMAPEPELARVLAWEPGRATATTGTMSLPRT